MVNSTRSPVTWTEWTPQQRVVTVEFTDRQYRKYR